jgi:fructose-1,6-bisphosphatase/inositol monophosphatase family enzyme
MGSGRISAREFVAQMTLPLWQAAAAVRWLEGRVENFPKSDESHPAKAALTYGDCVSQEILLTALHAHYPWVEIDAEEDTPTAQRFSGNRTADRVLVDPIDGTLRYVQRDGYYAILLGLEREGRVEAALIALPQEDLVVRAVRGEGVEAARAGGTFEPIALAQDPGSERLLVSYDLPPGVAPRLRAEGYELIRAAGGAIGIAPLLPDTLAAIRTTNNPQGVSRRTWVSTLATLEAGGAVETVTGPFPECYTPGIQGVLVASGAAEISAFRKLLRNT